VIAALPTVVVAWPFLAAAVLAAMPRRDWGVWGNIGAAAVGLGLAFRLPWITGEPGAWLVAGPAAMHLVMLGSFIGLAGAWFSRSAASAGPLRLYHALFQIVLGSSNLALLADNAVLTWVALEGGALALVGATLLPGHAESKRAAWPMLLLVGAALILTAFGTLLLYLAAVPALGDGLDALRWSALGPAAARCDGTVLSLAFVLLLLGYGGLAGLAPLQGWLLEAQAAPVALGGVLGGAVPSVALLVILRLRGVLDGNPQAVAPGALIMALGLAAVLLSGVGLWRARPERRWLALSSVGQHGVVAFAFGLGGAAATLAGLVHLTAHGLAKAAAFQAPQGRVTRWMAIAAVAGLPPFGVFGSLVLLLQQTVRHGLWLAALLGVGVAAGAWALMARLPAPADAAEAGWPASIGAWACLAGALLLGLAMPAAVGDWFLAMAAVAQ
jgi:hydrogenase-4 component F